MHGIDRNFLILICDVCIRSVITCSKCMQNHRDRESVTEITLVPSAMISRVSESTNDSTQCSPPKYGGTGHGYGMYQEPTFFDDDDDYSDVELESPPPIYEDTELEHD